MEEFPSLAPVRLAELLYPSYNIKKFNFYTMSVYAYFLGEAIDFIDGIKKMQNLPVEAKSI